MISKHIHLPTKAVPLYEGRALSVGSAFKNDIFYQDRNMILPLHGMIRHTADKTVMEVYSNMECYVNLNEGPEKGFLRGPDGYSVSLAYGDEVRIFGLWLLFLGKLLLVNAYYGDLRVAVRNGRFYDPSHG